MARMTEEQQNALAAALAANEGNAPAEAPGRGAAAQGAVPRDQLIDITQEDLDKKQANPFDGVPGLSGLFEGIVDLPANLEASPAGGMQQQGIGAIKGASFGLLGTAAAGAKSIEDANMGREQVPFGERRAAANEQVNANSGLVGEIAGSIAGAPRMVVNGIEGIGALGNMLKTRGGLGVVARIGTAATVGGGEAFLYSLNEGKGLDEASKNAMFGAGGGGLLQGAAEAFRPALEGVVARAMGRNRDEAMGRKLVEELKNQYGEKFVAQSFGMDMFDVDAIIAHVGASDKTMLEAFPPAFSETVRSVSRAGRKEGGSEIGQAIRPLMRSLENKFLSSLPTFQQGLSEVIGDPQARSLAEVQANGASMRKSAQPQYDTALNAARANQAGVSVSNIRKTINDMFGDTDLPANKQLRDRLLATVGNSYDADKNLRRLSADDMLSLRKDLDEMTYTGNAPSVPGFEGASSSTKEMLINYVGPLRDNLNRQLHEVVPGLKELDELYSTEARVRNAYAAGQQAFGAKEGNASLYDVFMQGANKTPADMASFANGVKAQLLQSIKKAPKSLQRFTSENADQIDLVRQVIGDDATENMLGQIERYALTREVSKGASSASGSVFNPVNNAIPGLADLGMMAGSAAGAFSSALGAGAARRQAGRVSAGNVGAAGEAAMVNNAMLPGAGEGARIVNDRLMEGLPGLSRFLPGFAASGNE
jgi:hypothetical protein